MFDQLVVGERTSRRLPEPARRRTSSPPTPTARQIGSTPEDLHAATPTSRLTFARVGSSSAARYIDASFKIVFARLSLSRMVVDLLATFRPRTAAPKTRPEGALPVRALALLFPVPDEAD